MIIDSIQQLQDIKERTLFIYPIQKDERLHNINNSIIGLVIIDVQTKQSYILSISHPEGVYQTNDLSFLKDNTIYCYNVETFMYNRYDTKDFINVKLQYYLKYNKSYEVDPSPILQQYTRQYQNCNKINELIPLYKHEEVARQIFNDCWIEELQHGLSFYQTKLLNVFHNIEKQGLKIDTQPFIERFGQTFSRVEDKCYTQYNYYTATGRPSNRFGGINFAALNKEDNTRECIVSEHGILVEMDFNSYHPRLIASIVGYDFGGDNVYEHLAKHYHKTDSPTKEQIIEAKEGTFRQLYGGIQQQYLHIPFFENTNNLAKLFWEQFTTQGYIQSPLSGRRLVSNNYQDVNCYTIFNYFIQMYETESNVLILKDLFNSLDSDMVPVLYTYDSILFDLPKEKYSKLQSILHKVIPKEFPFKLKSGLNYKDLQ